MNLWPGWERRKDELREEIETHLRIAVEDRVARGENPEEARAAALRELGNPLLIADVTREKWGWQLCERLVQDLRYAVRQLWRSPGYTATALITLTLAIGANTAIFGLLYAILLRSLPVERPDQIVQIKMLMSGPDGKSGEPIDYLAGKTYDVIKEQQTLMSGLCAWDTWALNLHDASGTRPVPTANLTGDCFRALGLHPALGRLFNEADDKRGGGSEGYAVVLGYDYWHSNLGGDPAVIGRVLDFQDKKGVVVGVLEPGFQSVTVGDRPSIYVPSEISDPTDRHSFGAQNRIVLGRLKDGVTAAQVQAQIDPIFNARLKAESSKFTFFVFDKDGNRQTVAQTHLVAVPGRTGSSYLRWQYKEPLYLIEGLVALSLLVACAYLATLAGARALARRRELAVRVALGASRTRLTAQLCCENLLLSLAGTGLGLLFAWGAGRVLVKMLDQPGGGQSLAINTAPTGMVLLFTLGLTVLTVMLAGVGPAWRASRVDPVSEIKEGEVKLGGRRQHHIGAWLAPLQIGLSLVIVVMAALMASTVARLLAIDPGFRTTGVSFTTADFSERIRLAQSKDKNASAQHAPIAVYFALLDRIRHTPGVESTSITQGYQLSGAMYMRSASSTLPSGEVRTAQMMLNMAVAPDYFQTLAIPILAGRDFTRNDKDGAPEVCILSKSSAQFFFPGRDAVGQSLTMDEGKKKVQIQVVAVVGDTLYSGLRGAAPQILYQPYFGDMGWNPFAQFAVRAQDSATGIAAVRNAFKDLAPDLPLSDAVTMTQLVDGAVSRERMVALLSAFFAALTLTLSTIGIYGLLNYSVVRRRTEIGVRMALGASRSGVVLLVLREALRMVLPGLVLGAAGAWFATRFLRTLLYGVKPLDPWMCAASVALLAAAAIFACALPARRAASVHPMEALRFQ